MRKYVLPILFLLCVEAYTGDNQFHSAGMGMNNTRLPSDFKRIKIASENTFREYWTNYGVMTKDDRIGLFSMNTYNTSRKYPYDIITKDSIWRDQNGFPHACFFGRDTYFLMGGNRIIFTFLDENESGMIFLPETTQLALRNGMDIYSNYLEISCPSFLVEGQRRYTAGNFNNIFLGVLRDGGMIFNTANLPWAEGEPDSGIGVTFDLKYSFPIPHSVYYSDEPEVYEGEYGYRHLVIMNGYVDFYHPDLFYKNNRVKKVLIQSTDDWQYYFEAEYTLEDVPEFQMIEFPRIVKSIRMIIKEVYRGTLYDDTVITALLTKGRNNYSTHGDMDEVLANPYYERWEEQ
jgi:hypothetical protein